MPKNAAIYVRQSKTRDGSGSIPVQLETCRQDAARLELNVTHELIEPPSTSGYKNRGRDRKRWKELLERTRTSEIQAVLVYKTDRLSRGGGPGYAPLFDSIDEAGG
jgi:DNA invertase Pin-like site-specific DNA recombinase